MSNFDSQVRLATPDDAGAITEIYAPIVAATGISFEEVPPTDGVMRERIDETLRTHPWLVYEEAGRIVGFAYSYPHRERAAYRWSVDVSIYLHEAARGRGVGRALYLPLFRILSAQGFHRAFAGIALPNDASIALHRTLGFTLVGVYHDVGFKVGAWRDVAWWERALTDAADAPAEPIPLPQLSPDLLERALRAS